MILNNPVSSLRLRYKVVFFIPPPGMAAEIQPPDWLRGQILLLPHVPGRGLDGVETVLRSGSVKQVRHLVEVK